MTESANNSRWGLLGIAGALGLCCVGTAALAGGAAIAGSTTAATTAVSGTTGGLAGILVTGLATALPLFIIGLVLRRRADQ
jgi:hypothetical protein